MGLWVTSFTGLFSNQRLFTKMCILDYLQFFSQETLSAPRPQSHLHEFIDSWLVPWEKERYWVENPRGSWVFPQEPLDSTPSSSPSISTFQGLPSPFTKLLVSKEDGRAKTEAMEFPSGFRAGLTPTILLFSSTKTHTKYGSKGKGRKLKKFSRLSEMNYHQATCRCPMQPAHQCYMHSSGCWARSPPHAGCTAQPALLWKRWPASHR